MSREQGIETWPAPVRVAFEGAADPHEVWTVPLTLQVPHGRRIRQARRPSARASEWVRRSAYAGPHRRPAPKRRLRREIRMAGYILMTAAPLALAVLLLAGAPEASGSASSLARSAVTRIRPPVISLSIEPPAIVPSARVELPVVLPGYLLPDDGAEESSHAGG